MPIITTCAKTNSQITSFSKIDDCIAYSTKFHGITLLWAKDFQIKQTLVNESLHIDSTSLTFSPNGLYLAFKKDDTIYIIDLQTERLLKTIDSINATISIITFDLSSQYLIVGTKEGRVLQYKYNDSTLLTRLISYKYTNIQNSHTTVISSLSFYKEYLVSSYFDGTIEIINLYSKIHIASLNYLNSPISTTCMIDTKTLIIGTKNGNLYIQDIYQNNQNREVNTPFTEITQIIPMNNPNYILISSNSNTISLVDIKKAKTIHPKYIELNEDISHMILLDENRLAVALKDNTIVQVELPSIQRLKSLMLHNSLDKAYALVEKNHMLYETQEYNSLQLHYRKTYLNTLEALVNENRDEALTLIDIFKDVTSKKHEIQALFKAFENYPRFKSLVLERKYTLAYNMSSKHPALQLTSPYRKMEKIFKEIFLQAQREILLGNKERAKELLSEFITVNIKRETVKLILNDNQLLIDFLRATEEHDFKRVHELAKKNTALMQVPTYRALENSQEISLQDIELKIHQGEITEAIKAIHSIVVTPTIAKHVKQLIKQCEDIQFLHLAYENSDFEECYEILDTSHHLSSSKLTEMLESHWVSMIQKAENFALKGNIKGVKSALHGLMRIKSRKDKIGDLLRVSFHVKIKHLLKEKNQASAENIIYSYIDIFGIDSELQLIMKKYERVFSSTLAITQEKKVSRDNWLNYDNIMN